MKKIFIFALVAMLLAGCSKHSKVKLLDVNNFTTEIDGKPVSLYTLDNGDLMMQVTNYGGRVVSLWTPDRKNRYDDIVLGYENIDRYVNNEGERFLGAAVGRYANRIGGGKFTIDGTEYQLAKNDNGNTLHGGDYGIDRIVWDVNSVNDTAIVLHTILADGLDGFPGNLDITMTYTLSKDNEFMVNYKATTDAPTVCNLSHHSFFNLKGEGNGSILSHQLMINGKFYTAINSELIPSGNFRTVKDTPMDFTVAKEIGKDINSDHPQMQFANGYDFNWVISKPLDKVCTAATVYEPATGRKMEVLTDQLGLQFYSGNFFDGKTKGKYGKPLNFRESLALEAQNFPDAPNQEKFPNAVLRPGEEYHSTTIYKFSAVK